MRELEWKQNSNKSPPAPHPLRNEKDLLAEKKILELENDLLAEKKRNEELVQKIQAQKNEC